MRGSRALRAYVVVVVTAGLLAVTAATVHAGPSGWRPAAPALSAVVLLSLMWGELRVVRWTRRLEQVRATVSTTPFLAALPFLLPGWTAVVWTAAISLVGDRLNERPWHKAGFNAGVIALAVGAQTAVLRAGDAQQLSPSMDLRDVAVILAALLALDTVNTVLVNVVVALATGEPVLATVIAEARYGADPDGLLVVMGPVLVGVGLVHEALVVLPLLVIVVTTRTSLQLADREQQSSTDPLTGLANRRHFDDVAVEQLASPARRQRTAMLLIDLNDFKSVNDTHGHDAGDRLLVEVATRLRAVVPATATCGRIGGDEFAVLLPDVDPPRADVIARAVADALAAPLTVEVDDMAITLTAASAVGLALAGPRAGVSDLARAADRAMYAAKREGVGVAVTTA